MAVLNLDKVKPGMILAESVYNQQGLLLLEKDSSLTKKRIWMLKTWGVKQVCAKGERRGHIKPNKTDEIEVSTTEAIENELKEKFADVLDDPIMAEIMKAASRHLKKNPSDE
jgi:hypothetical protein